MLFDDNIASNRNSQQLELRRWPLDMATATTIGINGDDDHKDGHNNHRWHEDSYYCWLWWWWRPRSSSERRDDNDNDKNDDDDDVVVDDDDDDGRDGATRKQLRSWLSNSGCPGMSPYIAQNTGLVLYLGVDKGATKLRVARVTQDNMGLMIHE